jgi:hypothetical protein
MMNRLFIAATFGFLAIAGSGCKDELTNGGITSCDFPAFVSTADSCTIAISNIFTPNGDGINDQFLPLIINAGVSPVEDYHLVVRNEGAITVFEAFDTLSGWDGEVGGAINFALYTVTVTMTIDATPYTFESYVYCLPYNIEKYDAIDCTDCRFMTQWDGDSFESSIDNAENICN